MDNHPANHIPSPLWPLCIPSRMGPSAFEPPPWAAGTRAYSVPAWRAGGRAVNRDGRWRVCAALAVDTSPSARTWNIPGTDGAKCFPYTPRGSRTSGRATSSRSIAPPATTSRCNHPVGLPWAAARRWPGRCPWGVFRGKSGAGLGDNLDAAPLQAWPGRAKPSSMLLDDGQRSVYRQFRRQGPAEDGSHDPRPGGEPAPGPVA